MKATSIKENQNKFQPDMLLYMETALTDRKAQISKNFEKNWIFTFGPCSFQIEWHARLKIFVGILLKV